MNLNEHGLAIVTINLTKKYKLFSNNKERLLHSLNLKNEKSINEFVALQDINLVIKKGQTIGILGNNGSGKSTLLKIISGIITPTSGTYSIFGTVAALLELGAGFNPELTGLQNIYLNGTLMGYSKKEIETLIPEILNFADIGPFIDQAVKLYSSGMFARLAFAVAISVEPDILIIDEALSVGDIYFQDKCYRHFEKLKKKNKTIILVTHSLDTIARVCDYSICLSHGKIACEGNPIKVIDFYKKLETTNNADSSSQSNMQNKSSKSTKSSDFEDNYGNKLAFIESFKLCDDNNYSKSYYQQSEYINIELKIRVNKKIDDLIAAFNLRTKEGVEVIGINTKIANISLTQTIIDCFGVVTFRFPASIKPGEYLLSLGLTYIKNDGNLGVYHRLYNTEIVTITHSFPGTGLYNPEIIILINNKASNERN